MSHPAVSRQSLLKESKDEMKSVIVLGALGVLVAGQSLVPNGPCPAGGGNFCVDSFSNIILRCSDGVLIAGNCNDNLAGVAPVGVKTDAICGNSSFGNADCYLPPYPSFITQPGTSSSATSASSSSAASSSISGSSAPTSSSAAASSSSSPSSSSSALGSSSSPTSSQSASSAPAPSSSAAPPGSPTTTSSTTSSAGPPQTSTESTVVVTTSTPTTTGTSKQTSSTSSPGLQTTSGSGRIGKGSILSGVVGLLVLCMIA